PTDGEFALPDDMAELVAAVEERKGTDKASRNGKGDAGTPGDGQPQNQPQAQPNAQAARSDTVEALKPAAAANAADAAASAAAVDAMGAAARTDQASADITHPSLAGLEGVKGPAGVDAAQPLATLRASRGAAHAPMGVPDQLAVHVQKNVKDGNDQFTINLRPDELGRIEIKLEFQQDGRVQAVIAVDKPQTLELLLRDARSLEKALQDAGLKADSGSLSFSLRGDGNPATDDGGKGSGSGRRGRGFAGDDEDPADAAAAYTLSLAPGRVDFRV
ncbi:MAG TPA: flagellar hook-length control protein FliK, partial [Azospirillum sp.]